MATETRSTLADPQWQKAPDTFQRSLTRPPLSRQKRQNARRDSSQVQSRQQIAETEFCRPKSISPELSSRHKATTAHPGKEAPAVIPFALSPRGTPRGPARFLGVPRNDITAIVSDGITTARSLALPSLPNHNPQCLQPLLRPSDCSKQIAPKSQQYGYFPIALSCFLFNDFTHDYFLAASASTEAHNRCRNCVLIGGSWDGGHL